MEQLSKYLTERIKYLSNRIAFMEEKLNDEEFAVNQPDDYRSTEIKRFAAEGRLQSIHDVKRLIQEKPFVGLFEDSLIKELRKLEEDVSNILDSIEEDIDKESIVSTEIESLENEARVQDGRIDELYRLTINIRNNFG